MFILSSSGISGQTNLVVTIVIATRGSCHEIWHIMETASKAAGEGFEGHPVAFFTTKHGFLSPMLESLEHKLRLVLHHSQYIRARLARDSTRDTETMRAVTLRYTHNARATEQVVESSKRLFIHMISGGEIRSSNGLSDQITNAIHSSQLFNAQSSFLELINTSLLKLISIEDTTQQRTEYLQKRNVMGSENWKKKQLRIQEWSDEKQLPFHFHCKEQGDSHPCDHRQNGRPEQQPRHIH
nr:hypothetical protein Iba_chr04dCG0660 [Ipomoea batatas]